VNTAQDNTESRGKMSSNWRIHKIEKHSCDTAVEHRVCASLNKEPSLPPSLILTSLRPALNFHCAN